jgi:hypothetical protein
MLERGGIVTAPPLDVRRRLCPAVNTLPLRLGLRPQDFNQWVY